MTFRRLSLSVLALAVAAASAITIAALSATRLRTLALEAERSLAETRHGRIEYSIWGAGPPVLVIHGAGGGFDQGRLLAQALGGDGFTYISVSRFGYLGSAMPQDGSTQHQAEAFADLLDALNIDRVGVLAMSGGAPPALKFAELYPDRTGRMALLSAAPFTPFSPDVAGRPMPTWLYSAVLGNDVAYWTLTKIARRRLERAFDARDELMRGLSPEETAFVRRLVDGFLPASARLPGVVNEGAAVDPQADYDLGAISAEALVIHARDDRLNPFAVSTALSEGIPRAELIALERGGHLLLGHQAALRARIGRFLGGQSGP
jgi:pimeloyl-ACP methyl ester carboxylesterase